VALPAELEHAPAESHYIGSELVESNGVYRLLLGAYESLKSPIPYHQPVTYLHVTLQAGERWTFHPNAGHDVAWLAVNKGAVLTDGTRLENEMVVFEEGAGAVEIEALVPTEFVIGSAQKHPYALVCGYYSVHTSDEALVRGEREIEAIGKTPPVMEAIRRTSR
jgi:redox-sensitive bicupin YhaK (pirin superfamily)